MSGSGPKTKGTDKIKFFKIDRGGDIAPAFPKDGEQPAGGEPNENTFARIEPVFNPDAPCSCSTATSAVLSYPTTVAL